MKKYLLGLFAIILAIGFSAFSSEHHSKKKNETPYYWYHVNAAQTQTTGTTVNPDGKEIKDDMTSEPCDDSGSDVCLAGFPDIVLPGTSITSLTSDELIMFTSNP